jgi:hypothetical protein
MAASREYICGATAVLLNHSPDGLFAQEQRESVVHVRAALSVKQNAGKSAAAPF